MKRKQSLRKINYLPWGVKASFKKKCWLTILHVVGQGGLGVEIRLGNPYFSENRTRRGNYLHNHGVPFFYFHKT